MPGTSWASTGAGVLASVTLVLGFQGLAVPFEEGHGARLFELIASAIAIPILSYMVLWMQRQARSNKADIEARAHRGRSYRAPAVHQPATDEP